MTDLEKLFYEIDKNVENSKNDKSYFEALVDYLELSDDEQYFNIVDNYNKEDIQKVYQFLLLKSLKQLNNPNYDITPEIIAMYVSHLAESIFSNKKINICDLASGSGNFLINMSSLANELTSIDVDTDYVKLQQSIFNLLEVEATIYNQDALKPLNIKPQDLIVSDTPLGYYADEDNSLNFKLCSSESLSLNALLFIEQTANYLAKDGVGILVVPKKIMELDSKFKKYLETDINLNAFITLPEEMFKNKEQQKAIVLITRKEQNILPKQVFLAELPSYQNKRQYANFIAEFRDWLASK